MKEQIQSLSARIAQTKQHIQTEEATKHSFVMPFIQILGYDIFNPLEVVPEFTADIGIKKGEKVDYAICHNGIPSILIECKDCNADLTINNESQLFRYFHASLAKFSILTNGISYKFFTDLEEPNKMDMKPFMEINLLEPEKINYSELSKFTKANFDADNVRKTADMLKCANSVRIALNNELNSPSDDFIRLIFRKMDCGGSSFTEKTKEKITPLVKAAIEAVINDRVKANLDNALKNTVKETKEIAAQSAPIDPDVAVTTQDEIDATNIIKAIAMELVDSSRIVMRDAKSYCAVLFDDNNRKPVARLFFNNTERKSIVFFDSAVETKVILNEIKDIFNHKDKILAAIKKYIANDAGKPLTPQ